MRLLLNLIMSLNAEEAEKLTALSLRGRQSAVMQLVYTKATSGLEPTPEEVAQLGLSDSHFYEISSVLLVKCYQLLVPEGGLALLEMLAHKNLAVQFKQELRRQRKHLSLKRGKEAEDFYLSAFELMHRFTYSLIDHELIKEYGKLYLDSKKDGALEDQLAVEARNLQVKQFGIISEGKNYGKETEESLAALTELERIAKRSTHPYLCYNVYMALAWYWRQLGGKPDRALTYLQMAAPFTIKLEGFVFRDTALEMQLRLADAHFFLGGTFEALEIFDRTYSTLRPDHPLWKKSFFLFRYLDVLIYNGKYARAEQILKEHFEPTFKLKPTSASATAATQYAVLCLLMDDYPRARHYLDIGMNLNARTNFTLYNEVRNRFVETAYYYLIGDWHHTLSLTNRGLQYLRGKNIGLNKNIFGYYFKIIEASIGFYAQDEPFWHKFDAKYQLLIQPQEGLFGLLIKKIRTTNAAKKKS